jgi:hypothetical protein
MPRPPRAPTEAARPHPPPRCGARTRRCTACGHRQKDHPEKGACTACGCRLFAPKLCTRPGTGHGGRCYLHGGKSLVGPAAPGFVHGRRSQYGLVLVGSKLSQFYEAAQSDPNLVTLRNEIALAEARIVALLDALQSGRRRPRGFDAQLTELLHLKRKLVEGQARVARDTFQMVTQAQIQTFLAQVSDLITRYVTNVDEVAAVVGGLTRLLGPRADPSVVPPPAGVPDAGDGTARGPGAPAPPDGG